MKQILDFLQETASHDLKMWQAKDFKFLSGNNDEEGGLLFSVDGNLFTGIVLIEKAQTSYSVSVGKKVKSNIEISLKLDKVSQQDLVRTIDDLIEGSYAAEETSEDPESYSDEEK